jgi:uncharacterized protein YxeA
MKNKILMIILGLIVVFSVIFAYTIYQDISDDDSYSVDDGDVSSEDVVDEMDESFVDEDDEVEIGDMV